MNCYGPIEPAQHQISDATMRGLFDATAAAWEAARALQIGIGKDLDWILVAVQCLHLSHPEARPELEALHDLISDLCERLDPDFTRPDLPEVSDD